MIHLRLYYSHDFVRILHRQFNTTDELRLFVPSDRASGGSSTAQASQPHWGGKFNLDGESDDLCKEGRNKQEPKKADSPQFHALAAHAQKLIEEATMASQHHGA